MNALLYYYPNQNDAGHYTANPRYFYDFGIAQIVGATALDPTNSNLQALATVSGYGGAAAKMYASNVPAGTSVDALHERRCADLAAGVPRVQELDRRADRAGVRDAHAVADVRAVVPAGLRAHRAGRRPSGIGYQLELATANTGAKAGDVAHRAVRGIRRGRRLLPFQGDAGAVPLVAGQPYVCAFLSVPQVVVSPAHVALVGIGTTGTMTATEPQYTGSFTAVSSDPNVVGVTNNGGGSFTLTAKAVGSVQITVTDSRGLSTTATASATTISLGVS